MQRAPMLFVAGRRWWGTGGAGRSIDTAGAAKRLQGYFPRPVVALQYPEPAALNGLVFDGDRIISGCPYAIVAAQFQVLEF
jgi:hypothetical protein